MLSVVSRASALALRLILVCGFVLGAVTGRAEAEEGGEEPPSCRDFRAFAEDYPRLEVIDCRGTQTNWGPWMLSGLLSWDGEIAAFEGGDKEGTWFSWPLAKNRHAVCTALDSWLRERHGDGIGFESHYLGCFVDALAVVGGNDGSPPSLEFLVHGVLAIDGEEWPSGRGFYQARLSHALDVQEVAITGLEHEPSLVHVAPPNTTPAPGEAGTGLAPTPPGALPIAVNVFAMLATVLAVFGIAAGFRTRYRP